MEGRTKRPIAREATEGRNYQVKGGTIMGDMKE